MYKLVRVERVELSSQVWKTCILADELHPRIRDYNRDDAEVKARARCRFWRRGS